MNKKHLTIGILMDTTMDVNDGVQQYVKALGRWLIQQGHIVYFLVGESRDEGEFKGKIISLSKNLNLKSNSNKVSTSFFPDKKKLDEVFQKINFDIIHVQMPYSPMMAGVFLRKYKGPLIGTFHILPSNPTITALVMGTGALLRKQIKKAKVLAVSSAAQKYAKKVYRIESQVVPNMVDIKKFDGIKLKKFDDGKINLLFLGRLVERKGAIYAIKAFEFLQKQNLNKNLRLIIAGDGAERAKLEKYVYKHKLENIVFEGYIEEREKQNYYASADICIFPSTSGESFGIVLIEAMAAGKPLLAFGNPGYTAVMNDTDNSKWIVENKNIKELAQKILKLSEDSQLRERLAKHNKRVVQDYDTEKVASKIEQIYFNILD